MAGKIATAVLLGSLLAPVAALSQDRQSTRSSGSDSGSAQDGAQVFLGAFRTIRDFGIESMPDSLLWELAIQGLIRELDDPYATVFTPEEYDDFREETTGDYAGIGVQISGLDGAITVTTVFRGTPADDMGLLVGDRIVGVNGGTTEGWSTENASDVIRGDPGTTVNLVISRDGAEEPIPYTIKRDNVHVVYTRSDMITDDVGYIHLDRVSRGSASEVDAALKSLSTARGIILDLRGNPGGYLDESLNMSDLFVGQGERLASLKSRAIGSDGAPSEELYEGRMQARLSGKPMIVLVDRFTASAAEIVTGAMQDHDIALVLGERTFGKGVVQTLLPLPAGRQIRLTTGTWYTPLGRSLHRARTREGQLLPEDPDTLPVFKSDGGREVKGGGGIFPDLEIASDTLTLSEREFLTEAARNQVPVNLRLAEFALSVAKRSLVSGEETHVGDAEFRDFLANLVSEGLPSSALEGEGVRRYLQWRAEISAAERADALGLAMRYRMERDPALTEAVRLLTEVSSLPQLFGAVDKSRGQAPIGQTGTGR